MQIFSANAVDLMRSLRCQPLLRRGHVTIPTTSPFPGMGECSQEYKPPLSRRIRLAQSINKTISSTHELRSEFLSFFRNRGHRIVAPSSIYPKRQEGSYFVNAGMNQFKPLFLQPQTGASEFSQLSRAANSQPCIRIGGRHDDLNDVGYDTYHHTMFEMLGNWSFGDYGKETACKQMWDFLTRVLGLPESSLYITYFGGCSDLGLPADDETRDIWLNIGVSDQKLMPFGAEHNFWRADQVSGAGLCGTCTEIHVDYRALSGDMDLKCARCMVNVGDPHVIELWNSVFITHRIVEDVESGKPLLVPLPHLCVDTGMGLERLASVMQGKMTTYDTDAFQPLFDFIQSEASSIQCESVPSYQSQFPVTDSWETESEQAVDNKKNKHESGISALLKAISSTHPPLCEPSKRPSSSSVVPSHSSLYLDNLHRDIAYRVLVDHARALSMALADGLLPGRQGIPLKLRHLIHRAARAACLTGLDSIKQPRLLSRLITKVNIPSFPTDLQGPSARPSEESSITPDQMIDVVEQEMNRFVPRLLKLEEAFANSLQDDPVSLSHLTLSEKQVKGLMSGFYGEPVSWDMICTQTRWFGLKRPSAPPNVTHMSPPPPRHISGRGGGRVRGSQISGTQLAGLIPMTDDSPKYHCFRSPSTKKGTIYAIPPLSTNLLGIVLRPDNPDEGVDADLEFITDKTLFTETINSVSTESTNALSLGLIFDSTNFFSPCGGQASDVGLLTTPFSQMPVLEVVSVEKLSIGKNEIGNPGWIVHWVKQPPPTVTDSTSRGGETGFILQPDATVRAGLMLHHTTQHLLNWAFAAVMADRVTNATNGTPQTFYHGSRVESDRCFVRLTLFGGNEADEQAELEEIVEGVETLCRSAIQAHLPVITEETSMEALAEKSRVKRFPWEIYPAAVRAVCIGGDLNSVMEAKDDDTCNFRSAELCGGTHLQATEDIVDVVITSCRARNQSVKEFVAIAGSRAQAIRHQGANFLLSITTELDSIQSALSSKSDLNACLTRLNTLAKRIDATLGDGELSFLHRYAIEQSRKRLQELQGCVKVTLRQQLGITQDGLLCNQLKSLFVEADNNNSVAVPFQFTNVNKLALAVKAIAPRQRLMVFNKHSAVFYDPQAPGNALKWADATISRLGLPDHLNVKVMAFKDSVMVNSEGRFAVAQLYTQNGTRAMHWQPHGKRLCEVALSS